MKSSIISRLLQASLATILAQHVFAQSATIPAGPIETLKCYSDPGMLKNTNTSTYQTDGLCQVTCTGLNAPVMAITGGSTCYCGSQIPSLDTQVASSNCNSPCNGFGTKTCGGIGFWQVYLTGLTGDVQTTPNKTSSSSSSSASSTHPAATIIVTQSATATPSPISNGGSGSSKIGIAVGVVVGVLVVAAIVGGFMFWLRQKRRREIEEEHKQKEIVSNFVASKGSDTISDQRLDPHVFAHRRESIGSIADEMDYSRRILQVSSTSLFRYANQY